MHGRSGVLVVIVMLLAGCGGSDETQAAEVGDGQATQTTGGGEQMPPPLQAIRGAMDPVWQLEPGEARVTRACEAVDLNGGPWTQAIQETYGREGAEPHPGPADDFLVNLDLLSVVCVAGPMPGTPDPSEVERVLGLIRDAFGRLVAEVTH